jgi:hypothetical protein
VITGDTQEIETLIQALTTPMPIGERLATFELSLVTRWPTMAPLVPLVTRLFDADLDPGWLPFLWAPTRVVILTVATGMGMDRALRRRLVNGLAVLHEGIRTVPGPQEPLGHLRAPFAAFHREMWRRIERRLGTPYVAVAGLVHVRARMLEAGMWARADQFGRKRGERLWDYFKTARVLCTYGPPLGAMTVGLRRSLIDACGLVV